MLPNQVHFVFLDSVYENPDLYAYLKSLNLCGLDRTIDTRYAQFKQGGEAL